MTSPGSFGMRCRVQKAGFLVLPVLLLAGCQPGRELPAPPPASPKDQERLEQILRGYDKRLSTLKGIRYRFKRTEIDATFNTRTIFSGEVVLNNPDLFRVEARDDKGKLVELFVWTGKAVYQAYFRENETHVTDVSQTSVPRASDAAKQLNLWMPWLWKALTGTYVGLPSAEAKTLFYIRLEKEDKDSINLTLLPRTTSCDRMRVVLDRQTFRIRQIWSENANGGEVSWDFGIPIPEKEPITEEALLKDFPKKLVHFPKP